MTKHTPSEEKTKLCKLWQQSDLTKKEFCQLNNISAKTFYRWLGKTCANNKINTKTIANEKIAPIKFLQVNKPVDIANTKQSLEIMLPNGINIKIDSSLNSFNTLLQELLKWK
jgi:hypothetical protein